MKKLKDFQKKAKQDIDKFIKTELKNGPVQISVDCTIENIQDISDPIKSISIKRRINQLAQSEYNKAKGYDIYILIPKKNQDINGFSLDPEIPLPVWTTGLLEQSEYTNTMLATGLMLMLKTEYNEYYHNVLKAINPHPATMSDLGRSLLDGSFWK